MSSISQFDDLSTTPISEQIMRVLADRIRAAGIDDVSVGRPEIKNTQPQIAKVFVTQRAIVRNDAITHHGNPIAVGFNLDVNLNCFVRNQNGSIGEFDSACNSLAAKVQKAITNPVNDSLWYRMGGLAINTTLGGQFPLTAENGVVAGVVVPLIIQFRVSENDPYEVRA